ncbi:hypothetical protein AJ79_08547 [Helicocarpus griseus UAMH5409]|uniref:Uncharacterized protein n=1 Tax=Helicocarpus griseus UAMH5409 TaxID=1447875 RepID=A0A2B7WJ05_9EURO|nr:hypothetical protein AJ79_08547 [Helicocarpus griseus UAMH5409]
MATLTLHHLLLFLFATLIPLACTSPITEKRQAAGIPRPPPDPKPRPGDGSGEFNSDGLCGFNDYRVHAILQGGVLAFRAKGWPQSARAMDHYLGESGKDLSVNVDEIMKTTPAFKNAVHDLAEKTAKQRVETFIGPWVDLAFTSPWTVWHAWNDAKNEPHNYDWYYALGEYSYAVTGVVHKARNGALSLEWKAHVFDRYNWDNSDKKNQLGWGIELSHREIGHLHKCGSAQEYTIRGSAKGQVVQNYDSKKPLPPIN